MANSHLAAHKSGTGKTGHIASIGDTGSYNGRLFYFDTATDVTAVVYPTEKWFVHGRSVVTSGQTISNVTATYATCGSAWSGATNAAAGASWTQLTLPAYNPVWFAQSLNWPFYAYTPDNTWGPYFDCSTRATTSKFVLSKIPIKVLSGKIGFLNPSFCYTYSYDLNTGGSLAYSRNLRGLSDSGSGSSCGRAWGSSYQPLFNVHFSVDKPSASTPINTAGATTAAITMSNAIETLHYGAECNNTSAYASHHCDILASGSFSKGIYPFLSRAYYGSGSSEFWYERDLNATELAFLNKTARTFHVSVGVYTSAQFAALSSVSQVYCDDIRLKLRFNGVNS